MKTGFVSPTLAGEFLPTWHYNWEEWAVSEKLDGFRAIICDEGLFSRQGKPLPAPSWWLDGLPKGVVLDVELWMGRGTYRWLSSVLKSRKNVKDADWKRVQACAIDFPNHRGKFDARQEDLKAVVGAGECPWLRVVPQVAVASLDELEALFRGVLKAGGEGLMLRERVAKYRGIRDASLLKIKPRIWQLEGLAA